ncbi:MAG: hypothetical protein KJ676_03665 [Alphaproteobacteria bacterium]|nr:hypothetical protein [Alphaproteobacteria bacterium]MBU1525350.1 hypothetical protein [Alphaproteobacteria bacterium]MBU2118701.1 hypothetical protein [Alphaproteobacteria bacterium]MBU2352498.1 hypothetical protein [Alphaproteobacteria bacterium]MBU2382419.1 hypothetical protein [Alphaproteobacteria bacterium]
MPSDSKPAKINRPPALSTVVLANIQTRLDALLASPEDAARVVNDAPGVLDATVLANVAAVEALPRSERYTGRDALLAQLGFGLEGDGISDHRERAVGARTVGAGLGRMFKARHIPGVVDAFQNIGKNVTNLARGNVPAFDALLTWMNDASRDDRIALVNLITARAALTARMVLPMPPLRVAALTFAATTRFLDEMLTTPSGGAYEQFAVAAFLDATLYEFGLGGTVGGLRVVTKKINASDASSGTAADVQIVRGNKIEEAFEVTANDWKTKVAQAAATSAKADLSRSHIIASVAGEEREFAELNDLDSDVSVLDVRSMLRMLCATLRKPAREYALRRLYELVDRNQPDPELTNNVVRLLRRLQLTDAGATPQVIADSET